MAPISAKVKEERLRWFDHVCKRQASVPVRRVESFLVVGVKKRGRPRRTWEEQLRLDLKGLNLSEIMTVDRYSWRRRIRVVDSFLGRCSIVEILRGLCTKSTYLLLEKRVHREWSSQIPLSGALSVLINFFTMKSFVVVVFIGSFLSNILCVVHEVPVSCMMAYEEGGAPAVFRSPECPQWSLSTKSSKNSTRNCHSATLQGHREYQEDRVTCNLDMRLPFSGASVPEEITVGIAAIFDGHGGEEASEMASTRISDYFFMHVVFAAYSRALPSNKENDKIHSIKSSGRTTSLMIEHHSLRPILEEALSRTIQDIDSEFSKEAFNKGYISGSTAAIVLLVNGEFFVANVGDSKALLCSQKFLSHSDNDEGALLGEIYAEELTRDHHPDREDEKARIEAAGGFVSKSSVPRVNGILAVSRAIGDVFLKRYGVTAEPELTGWRPFTPENSYLIVASDGVFETLTPQDVCDFAQDKISKSSSEHLTTSLLPEWIIRHALKTGSTDNLSAIVISGLHNCTDGR
ncbi:hypothetical protein OROGR_024973 [Orobanche gracilis]